MLLKLIVISALVGLVHLRSITDSDDAQSTCGYESCHPVKTDFINVHIVPHTHDDVGWLKTVDQYYYGSKSMTQKAGVQYILDSVVDALKKDPNRRFIYVETAFFWKWWIKQHDFVKSQVRKFVKNGQLEFIGGAWSMNDEAAAHYHSIIDQFTWGLRKLNDTFGECGRPKIGWQIDPFGHSREMASIFAQMGFDGLLLGRIDYQDKKFRFATQTPEMVWQASSSLGEKAELFTSVLFNNYQPPPGFCFDVLCADEPIIDDKKSPDYNVDQRVQDLFFYVKNMTRVYNTSNVLITMGEDFHYQHANMWFKNLDKLIKYSNALQNSGSKYNLIYSTPSCYLKAVHDEGEQKRIEWPVKSDDFFPYASDPHAYWTGYFTSRPTLKRFERVGNNFLQVCKQLYALADLGPEDWADLNTLREAMGVMQHHDAVTGTEKQHVADDYSRLLTLGMEECGIVANAALTKFTKNIPIQPKPAKTNHDPPAELDFISCPLQNISQCEFTEKEDNFVVTLYNPLSRPVTQNVRIPVTGKAYSIICPMGHNVSNQIVPIPDSVRKIPGRESAAEAELVFRADEIPPLGFKSFYITKLNDEMVAPLTTDFVQDNGINIKIDNETGLLFEVSMNGIDIPIHQEFLYYRGAVGDNREYENRSSGAYIFRTNGTDAIKMADKAKIQMYRGEIVTELHQIFNEYVSQVIRIYSKESYIEFDWLIGPIPENDVNGKEVITRFSSSLKSDSTFYTDSNGREMLKRVRNFRPTWKLDLHEAVAGNYYPVTSKIMIRDAQQDVELAILTDRAQGGASLKDGQIELNIHRLCLHDDAFGVDEALKEEAFGAGLVARGSHYMVLGKYLKDTNVRASTAAQEHDIAQRKLLNTWTFLSSNKGLSFAEYQKQYKMKFDGMTRALPANVQIMTLEPWKGMDFLLRLEHVFEKDEDHTLSLPVANIFSTLNINSLKETTLGGNQWLKENKAMRFKRGESLENVVNDYVDSYFPSKNFSTTEYYKLKNFWRSDQTFANHISQKRDADRMTNIMKNLGEFDILLNPMEIRTFVISVNDK